MLRDSRFITVFWVAIAILALPGFTKMQAQPSETGAAKKQEMKAAPRATTHVNAEAGRMHAAQQWLKSVGYDLTLDQMKTLKRLNLQKYSIEIQNNINDANMRHVEVLTNLETLQIPRKIGDEGLKHVAGLTNLTSLNIPICKVTDNGMQYLKNLTRLDSLVMSGLDITDAGVAQIKHLRPTVLNLTRTKITDAGVAMLKDMPLRLLFISFTHITDASIPVLSQMRSLERLDIQGRDGISQQGFEQLQAALPHTRIVYP